MRNFDAGIRAAQEQMVLAKTVAERIAHLQPELLEQRERVQALRDAADREQADVVRLQKITPTALFYSLTGKMDDKLEKEMEESRTAEATLRNSEQTLDQMQEEYDRLVQQRHALKNSAERYDSILKEKSAVIRENSLSAGEELTKLEGQMETLNAERRELNEAIAAGDKVLNALRSAISEMDDAEGLGTFDVLGGGLLVDLAKHDHLNSAQQCMDQVRALLEKYQTELTDVSICADFDVRIGGFLETADFLFDGLFADLAVMDEIHASQSKIQQVKTGVDEMQDRLCARLGAARKVSEDLYAKWEKCVLQA